jgi:hypothetical protein
MRASALEAALKVVHGVHGGAAELATCVRSSLGTLAEFRYHLYLSRRLGLIDVRRYRAVALRLEKTQKCLRELLVSAEGPAPTSGEDPATSFRALRGPGPGQRRLLSAAVRGVLSKKWIAGRRPTITFHHLPLLAPRSPGAPSRQPHRTSLDTAGD